MIGFHIDEEGDWVAHLDCGHRQHVRHRPPFQERSWVVDETGRRGRLGEPLECPLCDRAEMPEGLEHVRTTATWDPATMPPGLRADHRLAAGVWGLLVVEQATVRFHADTLAATPVDVVAGAPQPIPPGVEHHAEPLEGARFHIELFKVLPPGCSAEGGESPCMAHLLCQECGGVVEGGSGHRPGCPVGDGSSY